MKSTKLDFLFFLSAGFFILAKYMELSTLHAMLAWLPALLKVVRYASYALIILVTIFLTGHTRKALLWYILFLFLFLVISVKADSVTILFNFFFIFAAKDYPKEKLMKFVVTLQIVIMTLVVLGCFMGYLDDWIYWQGERVRHSLGYGYPNALPTIYFYVVLTVCYLLRKRFTFLHFVVFEILNYIIFVYTDTRTAFILTALALLVFLFLRVYRRSLSNNSWHRLIYVHSVWILALIAILACYFYNPGNVVWNRVNDIISNRLSLGHNALLINPLTLFGQKIQWYGFGGYGYTFMEMEGEYNYVDCSYVKILLDNGIIMLALAVLGYMFAANEELKNGNRYFCVALLFANVYSMIESRYITLGFNPFVWCLSSLIRNDVYISNKAGPRLRIHSFSPQRGKPVQQTLEM